MNNKTVGFIILNINLFLFNILGILPAKATNNTPVFSVVNSQNNPEQWRGISNRLQKLGVNYCVISLSNVKNKADWGKPQVLFLPNVEVLTTEQAIALDQWVSQGGYLIATGPVGNLSTPGVRQLLRKLLGGAWGFSLNTAENLQPTNTTIPNWVNQSELFGIVRGGVIIPNNSPSQTAVVWNSKDRPLAILTTEKSTLLGWRWGTDTVAPEGLDIAWLKASLNRHLKLPVNSKLKIANPAPNCQPATINTQNQPQTPTSPVQPKTISQNVQDPINQLEQNVRLDVIPNSNLPIDQKEAIALQTELENLISRVESAHIAASVTNLSRVTNSQIKKIEPRKTAPSNLEKTLIKARNSVKYLPLLIEQKNYAKARQLWLQTKSDLWQQFPINQQLAQPEIRSVWLDRGTIVKAGNEAELAKIFDKLAQSGINTIFLETINASYPIYPSQIAPQQNPLIRDWDPLASAVKLAHARGMELHAWVWVFAAGNSAHNKLINASPDYLGPVLAANPDWANYDNKGNIIPIGQTKPFFDPANPQVREYLLKLYTEIATRYQVDGIHLDYIRYPFQDPFVGRTYGYGKAAREQFQQQTGIDPLDISPSQRELWQKWTAFRTQQVDSFVSELSKTLRQKRKNLILSVAVFPLPEYERMQKIQQHWEVWARRGDIDLIVPMTYALDTPRFQRLAQPWISSTKLGATLLVPGIRLLSLPSIGAFDQLQLIRDLPVSGYALFAAENFNYELEQIFNSTQGRKNDPIPQRQPFRTAASRYAALQTEWQIVQNNGQLSMSAIANTEFNNRAKELQIALNQLANAPTAINLITARKTLTRFQSQFPTWIQAENSSNPYQIKVWQNRLLTIERLIRYGERRVNLRRQTSTSVN
ncbi:family 10 glycosylhydrolase [Anabaena sp. UHCC 0253]|uniref:family 10 glycosylhydrolase n=1 Tax=Anabaena sp. UHCC 0253 TaxID=2590019 RepID=UPI0014486A16|nr:family 10 glycosylhydrolase [Anabaena sp. UHCC 0253]MTJ53388.1 family 10 glycosylhydrolase [Anabaena sp. UHCC 0253]